MPLSDVIQLSISLSAPVPTPQGFGTANLLTTAGALTENEPTFYTSASAILADAANNGLSATDDVYKAAAEAFLQPNVGRLAITRIAGLTEKEMSFVVDAVDAGGEQWVCDINVQGVSYPAVYNAAPGDTVEDVRDGLEAAITALTGPLAPPVTVLAGGADTLAVTASAVGFDFTMTVTADGDGEATVSTDAEAVRPSTGAAQIGDKLNWYGISMPGATDLQAFDLIEWAATEQVMPAATARDSSNESGASYSLFGKLNAQSILRAAVCYGDNAADYPGTAWLANRLTADPDQTATTWAFTELSGVTPSDLSESVQTAIEGVNGNHYGKLGPRGATYKGRTPNGHPIDILISVDWLYFRLVEDYRTIFSTYTNERKSKVPYTDSGFALFENVTMRRLSQGVAIGHIAPGSASVNMPLLEDVMPADRNARLLRFSFACEPSGAIEGLSISGSFATPI